MVDWDALGKLAIERFPVVHNILYQREYDFSYEYTLNILCLMALADAFGFEYGEFVN